MLILLTLLPGLLVLAGAIWLFRDGEEETFVAGCFATLFGVVLLGIPLIYIVNYAVTTGAQAAQLEVQYDTIIANFDVTVTDTVAILTPPQDVRGAFIPVQGSIEKLGVGETAALVLVERLKVVAKFNKQLASMRYWASSLWLGVFYQEPHSRVRPLIIRGSF